MIAWRLSFTTRSVSRPQWRAIWRQLRIVNREAATAQRDAATFGTGYLRTGAGVPDFIERIHPSNVGRPLLEPQA